MPMNRPPAHGGDALEASFSGRFQVTQGSDRGIGRTMLASNQRLGFVDQDRIAECR